MRFTRRELSGAVADLGVFVPIAVALIVKNGLSPTAVLLPAGVLYVTVAFAYGLPIPVQPLKALGAIAIAKGLGADEIAAAALIMGAVFLVLGRLGLARRSRPGVPARCDQRCPAHCRSPALQDRVGARLGSAIGRSRNTLSIRPGRFH